MLVLGILFFTGCADYDMLSDDQPPDMVDLEVSGVSDTSVTLRWTRSDAHDFLNYRVYYSTENIVDTTDTLYGSPLSFRHDTLLTVFDLDANRQYWFRVIVTDLDSLIGASNTVEARTLRESRGLTLFAPDSITDSSVFLRWTKAATDEFRRYLIYADTVASRVDSNATPLRIGRRNDRNDTTLTVDLLDNNTTWWFAVHVESDYGIIVSSDSVKATTRKGVPDPVETVVDSASADSTWLSWSEYEGANFDAYIIVYDTLAALDSLADPLEYPNQKKITAKSQIRTAVHTPAVNTKYWFAVYTVNSRQRYAASNTVANFSLVLYQGALTDSTVELQWTPVSSKSFDGYLLYRGVNPGVNFENTLVGTFSSHLTVKAVDTAVAAGETWRYRVFVQNESGDIAGSNELQISVPQESN